MEEQEEPGDWEELEEYQRLEEDLFGDWSRGCGVEDTEYISGQAVPTARTYACVEVAEALIPSPMKKDPPTARNGRPTASGMSAGATAATADEDGSAAPLSGET